MNIKGSRINRDKDYADITNMCHVRSKAARDVLMVRAVGVVRITLVGEPMAIRSKAIGEGALRARVRRKQNVSVVILLHLERFQIS